MILQQRVLRESGELRKYLRELPARPLAAAMAEIERSAYATDLLNTTWPYLKRATGE